MLGEIIGWSLRHRLVVILAWVGIALAGVIAFRDLPIDAFPDTTPVQVQVNTVAPALSPLEVERQITAPVEQSISGLPGLEEVRSISRFGLSQVTVVFEDGTNVYLARQVVNERLGRVNLPAGVERPELGPVATGLGEVFHYLVTGKGKTLSELRTVQDWIIKPQLVSVPGVAEVNAWGGEERQIHVVVDPRVLQKHDLTLTQLVEALEQNNANVGGGVITQAGEASTVQGIGLVTTRSDVEQIVITAVDGVPIRVRDVASVVEGHEIRRGAVTAAGQGEVVLGLGFLLMGENSHQVTARLRARLDEVRKTLAAGGGGDAGLRENVPGRPRPRHGPDQPPRGRSPRHRDPVPLPRQRARRAHHGLGHPAVDAVRVRPHDPGRHRRQPHEHRRHRLRPGGR
jgi:cobalt-zinc-cadmium resistance protein CzcA